MMIECRAIPGFPLYYKVGEDGSVWTCLVRGSKKWKIGLWWRRKQQIAKTGGYPIVAMRTGGETKLKKVNILVATAFHGPCPEGMECRHLDGNPTNNSVANLKWGTPKENSQDMVRHGRSRRGRRARTVRLNEEQVRDIRFLLNKGMTRKAISAFFDVAPSTIDSVADGYSWWWLDGHRGKSARDKS